MSKASTQKASTPNDRLDEKMKQDKPEPDPVEEASRESFPASDPPAYTSSAGTHDDPPAKK